MKIMRRLKLIIKNIAIKLIQYAYILPFRKRIELSKKRDYMEIPSDAIMLEVEIMPVYKNKKGIVTIVSDDGVYTTAKVLNDFCKNYDIPISVAGTIRNIIPHLSFWYKNKNDKLELINHSYNHIRMEEGSSISRNDKELMHEIVDSKVLIEKITGEKCISFVCPENQMCSKGYQILKEADYSAVAQGTRGYNELLIDEFNNEDEAGSWSNLKRMGIKDTSDNPIKMRESWIEHTIANRKWLIEMWHNVSDDLSKGYQTISINEAKQHIEFIKSREDDIWIASLTNATKYIKEKKCAVAKAWVSEGMIGCYVELSGDIDKDVFDQELTVKVSTDTVLDLVEDFYYLNVKPGCIKTISVK